MTKQTRIGSSSRDRDGGGGEAKKKSRIPHTHTHAVWRGQGHHKGLSVFVCYSLMVV